MAAHCAYRPRLAIDLVREFFVENKKQKQKHSKNEVCVCVCARGGGGGEYIYIYKRVSLY